MRPGKLLGLLVTPLMEICRFFSCGVTGMNCSSSCHIQDKQGDNWLLVLLLCGVVVLWCRSFTNNETLASRIREMDSPSQTPNTVSGNVFNTKGVASMSFSVCLTSKWDSELTIACLLIQTFQKRSFCCRDSPLSKVKLKTYALLFMGHLSNAHVTCNALVPRLVHRT